MQNTSIARSTKLKSEGHAGAGSRMATGTDQPKASVTDLQQCLVVSLKCAS